MRFFWGEREIVDFKPKTKISCWIHFVVPKGVENYHKYLNYKGNDIFAHWRQIWNI